MPKNSILESQVNLSFKSLSNTNKALALNYLYSSAHTSFQKPLQVIVYIMQLEYLLEKYLFRKREARPEIEPGFIENRFNIKLPDDYSTYLLHYQGFDDVIGEHYLSLWNIDALVENNEGPGIQEFYPGAIGIGSDGAGELIALEHLGLNVFRVILTPFIGMDSPIEIGESFTDFLIRLDNGRNWFE